MMMAVISARLLGHQVMVAVVEVLHHLLIIQGTRPVPRL